MCNCKNIEFGDYDDMETFKDKNGKIVQVDKCLVEEIKFLRNECCIDTKASCCGHNASVPFIGVPDSDTVAMIILDYENIVNPEIPDSKQFFKPKSV